MTYAARSLGLAAFLALVFAYSVTPAAAQVEVNSTAPPSAADVYIQNQGPLEGPPVLRASAAPAAHLYFQEWDEYPTNTTISLYDASASGHLTQVGTYTLAPVLRLIGSNGSYLIAGDSVDLTANLWVYSVGSDGAIGKLASTVNAADYFGSDCPAPPPAYGGKFFYISKATLDRTGKYLYVAVAEYWSGCNGWESYKLGPNGDLTFLGVTPGTSAQDFETISSSDTFAYGLENYQFSASRLDNFGVWEPNPNFTHVDPVPGPSENNFSPAYVQADSAGYLAVLLGSWNSSSNSDVLYLASYIIDESTGSIKSTNTWNDMPITQANGTAREIDAETRLEISPSGKYLAANVRGAVGFQVFHFNGAAPITPLTKLISSDPEQVAWDSNDHLYVTSLSELYVYAVNSSGLKEITDFKYPTNEYLALFVVADPMAHPDLPLQPGPPLHTGEYQ